MTIEKILAYAYPLTSEISRCKYKYQRWEIKRNVLKGMIEAYKNGEIVDFSGTKISVDLDEFMKRLNS